MTLKSASGAKSFACHSKRVGETFFACAGQKAASVFSSGFSTLRLKLRMGPFQYLAVVRT